MTSGISPEALPQPGGPQEAHGTGLTRANQGPQAPDALAALRARARADSRWVPALLKLAGSNNRTNPRSCAETGT